MAKIQLDAYYPHPPEHVWQALTQPQALEQWLMLNEGFAPVVGTRFLFKAKPVMGWKGVAYCEVLAADAPRLLRWSQRGEEGAPDPFVITWTLTPEGEGTRLRLEHDGLHGLRGLMIKQFMGKGWKRMFDERIPLVLDYAQQQGWHSFPQGRRLAPSDCHA
jgi:uncharacterized protein YndB with AHSA1/START domain